jgi:hypothetical protein
MIRQILFAAALGGGMMLSACGGGGGNNQTAGGGASVVATLTLMNGSGRAVYKLDAAPHGTTNWQTNIIPGMRDLAPSGNLQFSFSHPDGQCSYDFIAYTNTGNMEMNDVNICQRPEVYIRENPA